jgi:uncharacterized protein YecE (DUF72 family)
VVTVHVGIAGFDYADWNGPVYPPGVRGTDRLRFVADYLDLMEINSTFYRIPPPRNAARWVAAVADHPGFRFTAKLWQGFTHRPEVPEPADAAAFRAAVAPLLESGRLAAVLAQFPRRFQDGAAARERLTRIAEVGQGLPLAVEVRHASFARGEALAFLQSLGLSLATLDMPLEGEDLAPHELRTGSLVYVRLHGRNQAAWFDPRAGRDQKYDWLYSAAELREWTGRIQRLAAEATQVLVVANNHFRGQAFANALELVAALGGRPLPVPATLLTAFPRLAEIARLDPPPPAQGTLFGRD